MKSPMASCTAGPPGWGRVIIQKIPIFGHFQAWPQRSWTEHRQLLSWAVFETASLQHCWLWLWEYHDNSLQRATRRGLYSTTNTEFLCLLLGMISQDSSWDSINSRCLLKTPLMCCPTSSPASVQAKTNG